MRLPRRQAQDPKPACPAEDLHKLEIALDQLERAELYVVAAMNLELADPRRRRELGDLRAQVAATRRSLARPRVVDQA
jgi:hypothetical protein